MRITSAYERDSEAHDIKTVILECKDVRFGYNGRTVLDGISMTIPQGELVGVIGPNGAGKSTLVKVLSGLRPPSEGSVCLNGVDLRLLSKKTVATDLAVVEQEEASDFGFTVIEEVMLGRAPHHRGLHFENAADRMIVDKALIETQVVHLADRRMETLSGGERQRVRIARALAQEPRLLLLDEPTNHLDLYSQLSLTELLREINREGLAIVMVSHDINFVSESCVHVKILSEGKLRGEGTPHEVITEQHLAQSFHIRAIVDLNPVTAAPRMTPLSRLCEAAEFRQNA